MVCYKGGLAIERNWQMCDVTSELLHASHTVEQADQIDRKIIDTIPDNRPPQVTFSCSNNGPSSNTSFAQSWARPLVSPLMSDDSLEGAKEDANGQCMFQFWVDRVESFYCQLDGCRWDLSESYSKSSYMAMDFD
jgi:hypothetical protein